MRSSPPLVSVIVPSFNQGRFIRETIESCLSQDYRPIEVLVLDGGSRDETVEVLRSFSAPELRWWSEPDGGVVDAVNKGLALARGDILTIQSSDDVFLPGALAAAVRTFDHSPQAGLAFGDVELMDAESRLIGADIQGEFNLARYLGRLMYIPQPGACFTRKAMEVAGPWRDAVSYAADADFWMRIATRMPVAKMAQRVARYRYHEEQRDTQRARIARDWAGAVRDLLRSGGLTASQRRHALMGIHLADYRYASDASWMRRTVSLYAAALHCPGAVLDPAFPRRELLPGRAPIWAALSAIKRRLGIRPRIA